MDPVTPTPSAPPTGSPVGRRVVLGLLGVGALGVVTGARIQDFLERTLGPLVAKDGTGVSALLPFGRFRIYTVTGTLPGRSEAEYRLTVDGLVDRPVVLDLADLRDRLPQTSLTRDFQCVTGWRVPEVPWRGVSLPDLLDGRMQLWL